MENDKQANAPAPQHLIIQGRTIPADRASLDREIRLFNSKLAQRTRDYEILKRQWQRIPWLWATILSAFPLAFFMGIWGIFIAIGIALSFVGAAYYITFAHISQHKMEIEDIQTHLTELSASQSALSQADSPEQIEA